MLGVALFPKQILLKIVTWEAQRICQKNFDAALSYEQVIWETGKILFLGCKLHNGNVISATFEQAAFSPFIHFKTKSFGGSLTIQDLKIVHSMKEYRLVFHPSSSAFHLFTFCLDTTIENGEMW